MNSGNELTDSGSQIIEEAEIDSLSESMSNADCVKVWLRLNESRSSSVFIGITNGKEAEIKGLEDQLYHQLTQRLVIESTFVGSCAVRESDFHGPHFYVSDFMRGQVVVIDEKGYLEKTLLYEKYCEYCDKEDIHPLSMRCFFRVLRECFPQLKTSRRENKYVIVRGK